VLTRRSLRRMIQGARHDERCCIALAVEVISSESFATEAPTGALAAVRAHLNTAAAARDRIDDYLDQYGVPLLARTVTAP